MPTKLQRARTRLTNLRVERARIQTLIDRVKRVIARNQPTVRRPAEAIVANVANQSSRAGTTPNLIVLHDTESHNQPGTTDLQAIVGWFDNPKAQASAHVIVDAEGLSARCVPDEAKAWHVAAFNSRSLGIEQVGYASQTSWPDAQLRQTARYIAYWSRKYGIPVVHSTDRGVCSHSDLGASGGGHHDPGPAYPVDKVLALARGYLKTGW